MVKSTATVWGRMGRTFMVYVVLAGLCFASSGCEPIRKKFIRQKKNDKNAVSKRVPVLEPELYPSKENDPFAAYKHHYELFRVWVRDLDAVLMAKSPRRKQLYVYNQAVKHLEAMENLLDGKNSEDIARLRKELAQVNRVLFETPGINPESAARDHLRMADKLLRKNLKPEIIADSFSSRPTTEALP